MEDDMRHSSCRMELMAWGKQYPKSGCVQCGSVLREGWKCPKGIGEVRVPPMGAQERLAVVYENGAMLLLCEGTSVDAASFQADTNPGCRLARVKVVSVSEMTESDVKRIKLQEKICETKAVLSDLLKQEADLNV